MSILSRALKAAGNDWDDLNDVACHLLDQGSHIRPVHFHLRETGSTLRVKGLEYDHVILLNPHEVPSAEHLSVVLSRAKQGITRAVP